MKKYRYFLIGFLLLVLAASTQAQGYTTIMDSLNGSETVNFTTMKNAKLITAECTEIANSDGTLALYGSLDGTEWVFLNFVGHDIGTASPKASITGADLNQITITASLVASWSLKEKWPYTRITGVGTANDSTIINIRYAKW